MSELTLDKVRQREQFVRALRNLKFLHRMDQKVVGDFHALNDLLPFCEEGELPQFTLLNNKNLFMAFEDWLEDAYNNGLLTEAEVLYALQEVQKCCG